MGTRHQFLPLTTRMRYDPQRRRLRLAPGWTLRVSRSTGRTYYRHNPTGLATWRKPGPQTLAILQELQTLRSVLKAPRPQAPSDWRELDTFAEQAAANRHAREHASNRIPVLEERLRSS